MGYRNREIEVKLVAYEVSLEKVNSVLEELFGGDKSRMIFGSSLDTYWTIGNEDVPADFIRMRERDGIRQITVKGKDRGTNLNRLEIDIDSTSSVDTINKLLTAAFGKSSGQVGKTYYVYWIGRGEYTTVCCYSITTHDYPHVIIEVESTSESRMLELEAKVVRQLSRQDIQVERAGGSLYELFVLGQGRD